MKPKYMIEVMDGEAKALALLGLQSKTTFSSTVGKIKSWFAAQLNRWMPEGYEDERGFHYGARARQATRASALADPDHAEGDSVIVLGRARQTGR